MRAVKQKLAVIMSALLMATSGPVMPGGIAFGAVQAQAEASVNEAEESGVKEEAGENAVAEGKTGTAEDAGIEENAGNEEGAGADEKDATEEKAGEEPEEKADEKTDEKADEKTGEKTEETGEEALTAEEPAAETPAESEEKPAAEIEVETEEKPAAETEAESEEKPAAETPAESGEKPAAEAPAESEEKPAAEAQAEPVTEMPTEAETAVPVETEAAVPVEIPAEPAEAAAEKVSTKKEAEEKKAAGEEIVVNTGDQPVLADEFEEDGSYSILLPEDNPFFPYEVQFIQDEKEITEWFMSPEDKVEFGGHTFRVKLRKEGVYSLLSLNIGGRTVVMYPEEKEFTGSVDILEDGIVNDLFTGSAKAPYLMASAVTPSIQPQEEVNLGTLDLSEFSPLELTRISIDSVIGGKLSGTDKAVWKMVNMEDDITISSQGDYIDLSRYTMYGYSREWVFTVGDANQLDTEAVKYFIRIQTAPSDEWLLFTTGIDSEDGKRSAAAAEPGDYRDYPGEDRELSFDIYAEREMVDNGRVYYTLEPDTELFGSLPADLRIYKGSFTDESGIAGAEDITSKIWKADMTGTGSGYPVSYDEDVLPVTMVGKDASGKVTGVLPFVIDIYAGSGVSTGSLWMRTESGTDSGIVEKREFKSSNGVRQRTYTLYKEYPADGMYLQRMYFFRGRSSDAEGIDGAYLGLFDTLEKAQSSGAAEIKDSLFSGDGYEADYSKGVSITVFYKGADGKEKSEKYSFKTVTGSTPRPAGSSQSSSSYLDLYGLNDASGKGVEAYIADGEYDAYGENNYITILVSDGTDLTNLAPVFSAHEKSRVYVDGKEQKSGKSFQDFSGMVQYTVASEDGQYQSNYWVQVIKPDADEVLYISSLKDPDAKTEVKDGVIHSTREILLDDYHDPDGHNILLVNRSTEPLGSISTSIQSDVLELDQYWSLDGKYSLSGFGSLETPYSHAGTANLAMIRLKPKKGAEDGTEISGTLTVSAGGRNLAVLTLAGIIGNPQITTKEIPDAVQYVPYSTILQNSNKYKWNHPTYELSSGSLPAGVELRQNGEIYGVPKETGTFQFTVSMTNSRNSSSFSFTDSRKTLTLNVLENTDANVDGETDAGYELTTRIPEVLPVNDTTPEYLMVSEGVFPEYVDIYLDGEKLTMGSDYTGESGSTRLTIRTQTLLKNGSGRHTLGIEYRKQQADADTGIKEMRKAAQNYYVGSKRSSGGKSGSSDSGSDSDSGTGTPARSTAGSASSIDPASSSLFPGRGITARTDTPGSWALQSDGSWNYRAAGQGGNWTGWIVAGNRWYYLEEDGKLALGWRNIGGKWYLFSVLPGTEGELLTGWQFVNGTWYCFAMPDDSSMGGMFAGEVTPDGYRTNADGSWAPEG